MNHSPLQNLLDIDQAIRHRSPSTSPSLSGRLAELIHIDPDIKAWLSWLCESSQQHTCGALEELTHDRELMPPDSSNAVTSVDSGGLRSLVLIGPNGDPVIPDGASMTHLRFPLVASGNYKLFTADRTLLWSQAMTCTNQSQPPDVWRLAAAPVADPSRSKGEEETTDSDPPASGASHTRTQRWPLTPWALTLGLNRSGSHYWLDITQQ